MKNDVGPELNLNWRYFSLEQANNRQGPDWKIWEQPAGYVSRGLSAFRAAEAARRQGEALFQSFHYALLRARHEKQEDIADKGVLTGVAENAGLDMSRFEKDFSDDRILARLAEDHNFAVRNLGIFGTPTLVFPEGGAVFLKMSSPPPPAESRAVFEEISHFVEHRPYILEMKRP